MRFILLSVILLSYMPDVHCATAEDVQRLFRDKLDKSNYKIRPLQNQSGIVGVTFKAYIVALTDINEVQQKVEATIWLEVSWENELLKWNKSEYGGLESVYPRPDTMWRPDLAISNGYNELTPLGADYVNMLIFHHGTTIWMPGQKVEFLCQIDVSDFPFDTQTCFMEFFNWGGTAEETSLFYNTTPTEFDKVEALHPNSEWEIIDRQYERIKSSHEKIRVKLTIKRKSLSLVLTVLLPVFLLSFLNVFVFLLPTESGEKLSFAVTVLLSQAVFLSFISGLMPQTSDTISGLSVYISAQLVLSTVYVLLTCCILRLHHRDTNRRPLPAWFLKCMCLNTKNTVIPFDNEEKKKEAFGDWVATGHDVSKRLDKVCFWVFFTAVVFMTTFYLLEGMTG